MFRYPRILHLADTHIGADMPANPRYRGPRRGDDLVASYRTALQRALEYEVDLVIHAGDVFDRPNPTDGAIAAAATPLLEIAARGVPIVIAPGNHERCAIPRSLLFSHPNLHIFDTPRSIRFRLRGLDVCVTGAPCIRRGAAEAFAPMLAAADWPNARGDVNLLVAHQTFESAVCGPATFRFRSGPDVIERDATTGGFDYVAAGHIHRWQTLRVPEGPPIVYAGSTDRVSFAEIDEPKGCVLIEVCERGVRHTFLEHRVRPMALIPLDVSGLTRYQIRDSILAQVESAAPEAQVMIRLSGAATRDAMAGLRLTELTRAARPDLLIRLASRSIEFVSERVAARRAPRASEDPFEALRAPPQPPLIVAKDELKRLPKACGVYAMLDALGRVLYVGKSVDARTRARAHLRGEARGGHFAGWTRQIERVAFRACGSELEAVLMEAELVRRLRPAFNRQMRMWARYCYIRAGAAPFGQLDVTPEPDSRRRCFGPYRGAWQAREMIEAAAALFRVALCPEESRALPLLGAADAGRLCERYYDGRCGGPCAGRVDERDYRERIAARDALFAGESDSPLLAWEQTVAEWSEDTALELSDAQQAFRRAVEALRYAFDSGARLRDATALIGQVVPLPGDGGRWVRFSLAGLEFGAGSQTDVGESPGGGRKSHGVGVIPKFALDAYLAAARGLAVSAS